MAVGVSGGSLRVAQPGQGGAWEEPPEAAAGAGTGMEAGATPKDVGDCGGAEEWLVEALLQHLCCHEVQGQVLSTIDEQCVHWAQGELQKQGMMPLRQVWT